MKTSLELNVCICYYMYHHFKLFCKAILHLHLQGIKRAHFPLSVSCLLMTPLGFYFLLFFFLLFFQKFLPGQKHLDWIKPSLPTTNKCKTKFSD